MVERCVRDAEVACSNHVASTTLDYLAGATGNAVFIGVSGSFFITAKIVLNVLFDSVLGSNSNRVLTNPDITQNKMLAPCEF